MGFKIYIICIIIIYIISLLTTRNWLKKAHSKNGRWDKSDTNLYDFLFTIIPIINTIFMIYGLKESPYKEGFKTPKTFNKFFNIKK